MTDRCPHEGCTRPDTPIWFADLHIMGQSPDEPLTALVWANVDEGRVHLHGWHLIPPQEDRFSRHLGRAIRSRLPGRVLRAETALRARIGELRRAD